MSSRAKKNNTRPLRNILANWAGFLFAAIVGFFLAPYVLGKLGTTSYGVWVLIVSLIGYLGLLDLGVRSAVTKFIASHHIAGEHERASGIMSAALLVFMSAALLAIILAISISLFVGQIFSIPPASVWVARLIIIILGTDVAVSLLNGTYGGTLAARHRFDLLNAIEVTGLILRTSAIVAFLESEHMWEHPDHAVIALATIQLASSVISLMLTRAASRYVYPEATFSLHRARSAENLKKIFSFGLQSSAINLLGAIAHKSSLLIIGVFQPVAMVTYYAIADSLAEYTRQILSGISYTVVPMVSSMEGAGEMHRVKRVLLDGTRYSCLVILPIITTFMVRGESFISLWMGDEYGPLSGQVLLVLSVALWAMVGYQICTTTMIGLGKQQAMVPIFAIEAAVGVSLSVVLIKYFGLIGAAWAILIPRLFVALVLSVSVAKKVLQISVTEYYLHSLLRPVIAILPFAGISYAIDTRYPANGLVVFFLQVALAIPVAMAGTWLFALNTGERNTIANGVRRTLTRQ